MNATPARHHAEPLPPPLDEESRRAVLTVLDQLRSLPGALLPVLHGVQNALGYIPPAAVPLIASELNLSRAEVHGVMSFYHFFRDAPPGRQVVYLCRAEACQANGCEALERHAKKTLGIGFHETTADGRYTLEPIYCLGNCACGPSMMVDDEIFGRVNAKRFDKLLGVGAAAGEAKS